MLERVVVGFVTGVSLLLTAAAGAAKVASRCDCYAVTAWTAKDGLPVGNVLAITQDSSGFLWLGMNGGGLVRFDGFQFLQWSPSSGPELLGGFIPALVGAHDGSLWVGFGDATGVSHVESGRVVNYSAQDGLDVGTVAAMLEDRDGVIWVGGIGGLWAFQNRTWHHYGRGEGLPSLDVFSVYEDHEGSLWIGTSAGIFRRRHHDRSFSEDDRHAYPVQSFAEDSAGTMFVSDTRTIIRTLNPAHHVVSTSSLNGSGARLLHDRAGDDIWIAALGEGLFRAHRKANAFVVDRFAYEDRFTGAARSLFEDRDDNIWVGLRSGGLLRLSASPIRTDTHLEGLTNDGVRALTTTSDGSLWIATGHDLNRFTQDGGHTAYPFDQTLALQGDPTGRLWAVTPRGAGPFVDGRFAPIALPPSLRLERTLSFVHSPEGLWMCNYDQGLSRWRDGTMTTFEQFPNISHRPCDFVYTDRGHRIWVGFVTGDVAVYDHNTFHLYTTADGLAAGSIQSIFDDGAGAMWVSTKTGLTRISGGRLTTVTERNGLPGNLVPSLVQDRHGDLWIGVDAGASLVRIDKREIDKVAVDPFRQVAFTLYDESDGLKGPLLRLSRPTAVATPDGSLWFASGDSVAVIDPDAPIPSHTEAVPRIDRIVVDGKDVVPSGHELVSGGIQSLEIDYAALNLSSASKLRFSYILQGFDRSWVEAGSRRQVSYTNLSPGTYRFRVRVDSAGPAAPEASWAFSIPPPFYRTYWFYALTGLAFAGAFSLLWWLRLRSVRNEYALVIAERARVSRDIHDTLLQSLGAFSLQLEIIARQLDPSQDVARDTLRHVRVQIGECLADARRAIWQLRSPRVAAQDLADALTEMAHNNFLASAAHIEVLVHGRARRCSPQVEEQLLRIAQEAITNAIQHGRADEIDVALEYSRRSVSLSVSDNGCGFIMASDTTISREHFGLKNMQERAATVRGTLTITSTQGDGTIVKAVVPYK